MAQMESGGILSWHGTKYFTSVLEGENFAIKPNCSIRSRMSSFAAPFRRNLENTWWSSSMLRTPLSLTSCQSLETLGSWVIKCREIKRFFRRCLYFSWPLKQSWRRILCQYFFINSNICGNRGLALDWIRSCFASRMQYIELNGRRSLQILLLCLNNTSSLLNFIFCLPTIPIIIFMLHTKFS